ncbi:MAG: hypothetical protein M1812_000154 [Candelaria pacifica]|nr:MAG: hypothetical protein M1812_000154 [Candelaria pacifica]
MSLTRFLPRPPSLLNQHSPIRTRIAAFSNGQSPAPESIDFNLNPRWMSELKARIGRCIMFGLKPHQNKEAGEISAQLARDWRELVAGSEGFLTGKRRRGLYRHEVVWGEMVGTHRRDVAHIYEDTALSGDLNAGLVSSKGHVNNVTYVRYAESARINWAQNFANHLDPAHKREWSELWTPQGEGFILRSIKTEFKFPMTWPDHITVYHKLRSPPSSSTHTFVLDVLILSELHQRPAARCVEDIVLYDYKKGGKTTLKPFMADEFTKTFALQQGMKTGCGNRVKDLIARVERLEKDSWDRVDAQEDHGGSCKPDKGHPSV